MDSLDKWSTLIGRYEYDTQHNDIQPNDAQHNDSQQSDTQHNI